MKRRTVTLVIFLLLSSLTFLCPRLVSSFAELRPGIEPQRSVQTGRRARRPARPQKPQIDYSKFNHNRPEHSEKPDPDPKLSRTCESCHTVPALTFTGTQQSTAYDIKDYPKHESCIGCHREQFYKGARPAICSNCHTVVSPRSNSRFSFPKRNADPQVALQFPHSDHLKGTARTAFKNLLGKASNVQASCMYCHKPNTTYKPPKGAPEGTFPKSSETFLTTPTSHTTCFQCHWREGVNNRSYPPLATECVKCHNNKTAPPSKAVATTAAAIGACAQKPTPTPVAAHAAAQKPAAPAPTPIVAHNVPEPPWADRIVQKFRHDKNEHMNLTGDDGKPIANACTQCHKAVKDATNLKFLTEKENRVQLPSCSSTACHMAVSGSNKSRSVYDELQKRKAKPDFECVYCHTPPQSLAAVPCSHYTAMWEGAVKEKKSATTLKNIEDLFPECCAEEFCRLKKTAAAKPDEFDTKVCLDEFKKKFKKQ